MGGWRAHRRRDTLRPSGFHNRSRGRGPRHQCLSCRPRCAHASRASLQRHMLPAPQRGQTGLLHHIHHGRQRQRSGQSYLSHSDSQQPPFHLRGGTGDYRKRQGRICRRDSHPRPPCQDTAPRPLRKRLRGLRPRRGEIWDWRERPPRECVLQGKQGCQQAHRGIHASGKPHSGRCNRCGAQAEDSQGFRVPCARPARRRTPGQSCRAVPHLWL